MRNCSCQSKALLILLTCVCFCFLDLVWAQIPQLERDALIALYNSTDGNNWTNKSGWKEPPLHTDGFAMPGTEEDWHGIDLSGGNTVWWVDLANNNLNGTLPPEIGDFTNIAQLNLTNHRDLIGSIPPEIGNLTSLITLELFSNSLTGSIPNSIGNLINLERLVLPHNELSGSIPAEIGLMENLEDLDLRNNQLTGVLPNELGNLDSLKSLQLNQNELESSDILVTALFRAAFEYNRYGFAAAFALVIFVILLLFCLVYMKAVKLDLGVTAGKKAKA